MRPPASAPLSTRIAYAAWLERGRVEGRGAKYWKEASTERPTMRGCRRWPSSERRSDRPPRRAVARIPRPFPLLRRADGQVRAWAEAFPTLCRDVDRQTPEGRELWLLTSAPNPIGRDRARGWTQHACQRAVRLERGAGNCRGHPSTASAAGRRCTAANWSAAVEARLRDVRFYVLPRMSPDGAEAVMTNGRYVRSVHATSGRRRRMRTGAARTSTATGWHWRCAFANPAAKWSSRRNSRACWCRARSTTPPPYYKIYPEGVIDNFDGTNVPSPYFLSDNQTDLNRNFPYFWAPIRSRRARARIR